MAARDVLSSFKTAAWLGWQIEGNWTSPIVFIIYTIVKPISSALLITVLYVIAIGPDTTSSLFAYVYVGNASYRLISSLLSGSSGALLEDREFFRTLKYIYASPAPIFSYLLGRSVVKALAGLLVVVITLAFGVVFLGVSFHVEAIDYTLLAFGLVLALISFSAIGLALAGVSLVVARHSWFIGESVSGVFFLISGAIFPPDILPGWVRPVSLALPTTYWLEAMRRALVGETASLLMQQFSDQQLLGLLGASAIIATFIAVTAFRVAERHAKKQGLLDITTAS